MESSSLEFPPPKRMKFSLPLELYDSLEHRDWVDGALLVGTATRERLRVDVCVLTANSKIFDAAVSRRWQKCKNTTTDDIVAIDLPPETTVETGKLFIKAMYTSEVDFTGPWVNVLDLCNLYLDDTPLAAICQSLFAKGLTRENCIAVVQLCYKSDRLILLEDAATCCVRRHYIQLLSTSLDWTKEVWDTVLQQEGTNFEIDEMVVFKNLMRWIESKPSHKEYQGQLLKLVRFPLMGNEEFLNHVDSRGLLTGEQVANVLAWGLGGGRRIPSFNWSSRNVHVVNTSLEFNRLIRSGDSHLHIKLLNMDYYLEDGVVDISRFTLEGVGPETTIINMPLENVLDGFIIDCCKVSNLTFVCSPSKVVQPRITINGSRNVFEKVKIVGGSLNIVGSYNHIGNVEIDNTGKRQAFGLVIRGTSSGNEISNLILKNVSTGYEVRKNCKFNKIQNVTFLNVEKNVNLGPNNIIVENAI